MRAPFPKHARMTSRGRIGRRDALKGGLCLGLGVTLAPALAFAQALPESLRPREGDLLVKAADAGAQPLGVSDIEPGRRQTLAWAMDPVTGVVRKGSRLNLVLLVRLATEALSEVTRARSADGVVAYTAICTHTGCEVEDWDAEAQLLYCGCHSSAFDPKDDARVIEGPAPRMLPALPLRVVDGRLVVAGPFTSRIGFESV